jgi:hypothetical protein
VPREELYERAGKLAKRIVNNPPGLYALGKKPSMPHWTAVWQVVCCWNKSNPLSAAAPLTKKKPFNPFLKRENLISKTNKSRFTASVLSHFFSWTEKPGSAFPGFSYM